MIFYDAKSVVVVVFILTVLMNKSPVTTAVRCYECRQLPTWLDDPQTYNGELQCEAIEICGGSDHCVTEVFPKGAPMNEDQIRQKACAFDKPSFAYDNGCFKWGYDDKVECYCDKDLCNKCATHEECEKQFGAPWDVSLKVMQNFKCHQCEGAACRGATSSICTNENNEPVELGDVFTCKVEFTSKSDNSVKKSCEKVDITPSIAAYGNCHKNGNTLACSCQTAECNKCTTWAECQKEYKTIDITVVTTPIGDPFATTLHPDDPAHPDRKSRREDRRKTNKGSNNKLSNFIYVIYSIFIIILISFS